MYLIELGIDKLPKNGENTAVWLQKILEPVEGIESVSKENQLYRIECSKDISSSIARRIMEEGMDLHFLNRKEYGLDAIYNRYFEKGIK